MVTDQQVRRLLMNSKNEKFMYQAADKARMSERTARKYLKIGKLPSQLKKNHDWPTREDPFRQDWPIILEMLELNSGLEAKTVFEYLCRDLARDYQENQLRTLQRRFKNWRATQGPAKEVYFSQIHYPGDLAASDFTHMNDLGITIQREAFSHMLFHFVLTYSNWETFTICYSESLESLSAGFQNALWELGGCPKRHRTDRMSAAVNNSCNPEKFTKNYEALLNHYAIFPERTNPNSGNENGDVESSHRHFKRTVSQALMLRGSKDFKSFEGYERFLRRLAQQLNAGRNKRLDEELKILKGLPAKRLTDYRLIDKIKVGKSSTINILKNTYSVHSRLIGERINIRVHIDRLEIWYGQKKVDTLSRLRGRSSHRINYRHIIDWLVRKPGAFENYRYKSDLFLSSWFRMAYDWLKFNIPLQANKNYVKILYYASQEGETVTENVIRYLINNNKELTAEKIKEQIDQRLKITQNIEVTVMQNELKSYDALIEAGV